ncbi:MAG TPA: DUF1553 domain-containing protein, partial [Chthoniobacteraceae bacterium]|nr:DUF1553 domain-containing protein [Chthoniobacteraceae bacterium]
IFDGPSVTECYQRHQTVMPQQSLALANGELTLNQAKTLAKQLGGEASSSDEAFIRNAYARVLARIPLADELTACLEFLKPPSVAIVPVGNGVQTSPSPGDRMRQRENLVMVLFNHNDFVTIR